MAVLFQIICGLIVCGLGLSLGIIFAWPSSTVTLLRSENTVLYRPMTNGEVALLGSLSCAGAMVGTAIFATLIDKLGRKKCAILCSSTNVVGWIIICASRNVEAILSAVFIAGLGGGGLFIVSVFIPEFCQTSIRGAMSSCGMVLYAFGTLLAYLVGGLLSYWHTAYVSLALVTLNLGLLLVIKESPLFLLMKGFEKEAAQSIAFYRRVDSNSNEVFEEIVNLRRTINAYVENEISSEEQMLNPEQKGETELSLWQFLKKSRATRKAMVINLILMAAGICQGMVVVQVYAQPLFETTVPEISATLASVLFAIINVIMGFLAAYLSEKAGRKPLIIYSSIGTAICCLLCGLQIQFHLGPNWLVPIYIYIFAVFFSMGGALVPYIMTAELFLPEVKSYMSMLALESCWLSNFLVLFLFEPVKDLIGLGPVLYFFALVCLFTMIFSIYCVPETKGVPLYEVQKILTAKKNQFRI